MTYIILPMTTAPYSQEIPDRTAELTFPSVSAEAVRCLISERVVVIQNVLGEAALQGIEQAYHTTRKHQWARRGAGRVIRHAGFSNTQLYRRVRVSDVPTDPLNPSDTMHAAKPALRGLVDVYNQFFGQPELVRRYGRLAPNLALFFASDGLAAFGEHQDSQGATGIALSPQPTATQWYVHNFNPDSSHPPAPIQYGFQTAKGSVVALMQREGPAPAVVPYRQSAEQFFADASLIHSGVNLEPGTRFGIGVFHQEVPETIL